MFGFGAGFVLTQFGLRWMLPWLGVAISIPTSTLVFWCLASFSVDPSDGNLKAVVLFACVGLPFPGVVALLNFESNRLMGPNIAGTLSSITPVFAVLLAIVIYGERIRGPQLLGLAAIVIGISLMYRVHVKLSAIPGTDYRGALWFAVVGLCNGLSVLAMYAALAYGPVTVVSPLIAGCPLVTLLLSRAFLGRKMWVPS